MSNLEPRDMAPNNYWHDELQSGGDVPAPAEQAQLALVFEQRTANLIAYLSAARLEQKETKELHDLIRPRLGLEPDGQGRIS